MFRNAVYYILITYGVTCEAFTWRDRRTVKHDAEGGSALQSWTTVLRCMQLSDSGDDVYTSAVRIVFFFISNRIVIVGVNSHQQ